MLWCGIVLVLKSNIYFIGKESIEVLAARLPVHVQRFFGALFSTFETLMGHQRDNSNYLVQSLLVCVQPDAEKAQMTIIQMVKDYKSLFSYAYMFNRRTGVIPTSQLDHVVEYFKQLSDDAPGSRLDSDNARLLLEDDNDSYDQLMSSTVEKIAAPKFGAPSVLPLRPVKLLSDDEHYGSDYQPAVASDRENDLFYNKRNRDTAPQQPPAHLTMLNDDSMYSMDGGSILNSYYKYNGWNNTFEEDEDSGNDQYQPPVPAPRTKRVTRMRQQQAASAGGAASGKAKKVKTRFSKHQQGSRDAPGRPRLNSADNATQSGEDSGSLPSSPEGDSSRHSSFRSDEDGGDLRSSSGSDVIRERDRQDRRSAASVRNPKSFDQQEKSRGAPTRKPVVEVEVEEVAEVAEVEDFETLDEDRQRSRRTGGDRGHDRGRIGGAIRRAEPHSPSSAGSSIELSDREKRSAEKKTDRAERDAKLLAAPARRRSALSDDDSDEDARWRSRPQPTTRSAGPRTANPLDASLESERFAAATKTAPQPARVRNPLESSVEGLSDASDNSDHHVARNTRSNATTSGATSSRSHWTSAGTSDPWRTSGPTASTASAQSRSVVRMPSASPSKPDPRGRPAPGWQETEGADDVVEDWDSPSDSGGSDSGRVETKRAQYQAPVQTAQPPAHGTRNSNPSATSWGGPGESARAPQVSPAVGASSRADELADGRHDHPSERAGRREPIPEGVASSTNHEAHHGPGRVSHTHNPAPAAALEPPRVTTTHHAPRDTRSAESPTYPRLGSGTDAALSPPKAGYEGDERAAAIEKMKENILRKKREKERQQQQLEQQNQQQPPPSGAPPLHRGSREPSPARQTPSGQPSPAVPVSILRKSVTFHEPVEQDHPSPHSTASDTGSAAGQGSGGPVRMNMSRETSAEDLVLYGSRPVSLSVAGTRRGGATAEEDRPATRWSLSRSHQGGDAHTEVDDAGGPPHPHLRAQGHAHHHPQVSAQATAVGGVTPHHRELPGTVPTAGVDAPDRPRISRVTSEQLLPPKSPASNAHDHGSHRSTTASSSSSLHASHPGPASFDGSLRQLSSSSINTFSTANKHVPVLPDHYQPPPPSEFAQSAGIILEGYLHKKSAGLMGQWQKVRTYPALLMSPFIPQSCITLPTVSSISSFCTEVLRPVRVDDVLLRAADIHPGGRHRVGPRRDRSEGLHPHLRDRERGHRVQPSGERSVTTLLDHRASQFILCTVYCLRCQARNL